MAPAWCDAPWRTRLLRRLRVPPALLAAPARRSGRWAKLAADLRRWGEVRARSTPAEWRRLTSSYPVLVYHRFAGELKPGQERIDIAPARFFRQLRLLRLLGFRPLPLEDLLSFHRGELNEIPRRRFVLTVDDALADAVEPLRSVAALAPQLFVPTRELGGRAHWIGGEPVASWAQVRALADAGVTVGSHARRHRRLTELAQPDLEDELRGSLADLRANLPASAAAIAYPNGDHDEAVVMATRAAGYQAAYTTEKGRNDAATDPFRLRRVSVHGSDGPLAVLWKVLTGEPLPRLRPRRRRSRSSAS